jgi:hypothetical protein
MCMASRAGMAVQQPTARALEAHGGPHAQERNAAQQAALASIKGFHLLHLCRDQNK